MTEYSDLAEAMGSWWFLVPVIAGVAAAALYVLAAVALLWLRR